ncbi:hypothetical protein [Winogradskyella sp. UBA3174]|uniref:hypothetical protein n=1 Tax=Winogradskyella sp. UBA3174 TaxID=1947785 RepID=UPI0025F070BE|nr:hypothetical protein [Winogradskyella sp. UBA3174]|tara:strand:+ start:18746 stop:19336 length:591 start_codon:yes stop_codon:yes gene_type:complete
MKITTPLILITALVFQLSCSSQKQDIKSSNGSDSAIESTITDFFETSDLYKDNKVFGLTKQDVLHYVKGDVNKDDYRLINNLPHQSLINISIRVNSLSLSEDITSKIGTISTTLPSRYIIKDKKLFYWWDSGYAFTQETYDTFKDFGIIGGNTNAEQSQKGINYYFCSSDLTKFIKLKLNEDISNLETSPIFCKKK